MTISAQLRARFTNEKEAWKKAMCSQVDTLFANFLKQIDEFDGTPDEDYDEEEFEPTFIKTANERGKYWNASFEAYSNCAFS